MSAKMERMLNDMQVAKADAERARQKAAELEAAMKAAAAKAAADLAAAHSAITELNQQALCTLTGALGLTGNRTAGDYAARESRAGTLRADQNGQVLRGSERSGERISALPSQMMHMHMHMYACTHRISALPSQMSLQE